MARCDARSAQEAGVDCQEFDRLQLQVANQVRDFRTGLRNLGAALKRKTSLGGGQRQTTARFDKYMGKNASDEYAKLALVHNVLANAERQLRNPLALAVFDRRLGAGGDTKAGLMKFGDKLSTTTILHEAIHFGTAPWQREGDVPLILDHGSIGSYLTYSTFRSALERSRYGWKYTSRSAASYAWVVTGP